MFSPKFKTKKAYIKWFTISVVWRFSITHPTHSVSTYWSGGGFMARGCSRQRQRTL